MSFLHPALAAAGVACVAIPIIIHLLFRQRRRPMAWAAMRFVLEAIRKQRKRLRLETLLLLLARCLILCCLGLAIGRPALNKGGLFGGSAGRDVYILLDNSLAASARAEGSGGAGKTALDRHKDGARAVLDGLGSNDRAGLVLLGGPADATVVPASPDVRAVRELVGEASPCDSAADIAGALEALAAKLGAAPANGAPARRPVSVVILSDFTGGSADLSRPLPVALKGIADVTVLCSRPAAGPPEAPGNVQITSMEPLRGVVVGAGSVGSEATQVRVAIRRAGPVVSSEGVTQLRVRVAGASAPPTPAQVRWSAGQSEASVTVQLDAGAGPSGASGGGDRDGSQRVLVAEIDRDSIPGDNTRRRAVEVRERLQVGVVAQRTFGSVGRVDRLSSADWFRLALRPGEGAPVEVIDIEPAAVDSAVLSGLDAVVLPAPDQLKPDAWAKLRKFADAGGLVIVSPPEGAGVHLWADAFTKAMGLSWRVSREVTGGDDSKGAVRRVVAPQGSGGSSPADVGAGVPGGAGGPGGDGATIFALLAPELGELLKPVSVSRWLTVDDERGPIRPLLSLEGGAPWLLAARVGSGGGPEAPAPGSATPGAGERPGGGAASTGRGLVVFFASAPVLSWTDLPARPLMVPLVQELLRQGVGESGAGAAAVAGRAVPVPAGTVELRPIEEQAGGSRLAVGENGRLVGTLRTAGLWRAVDGAGRSRGVVAVNADAEGGKMTPQSPEGVRSWLVSAVGDAGDGGAKGGEPRFAWLDDARPESGVLAQVGKDSRSRWVPVLFGAALALALVELLLARWFSHAFAPTAGGASASGAPSIDSLLVGAATPGSGRDAA